MQLINTILQSSRLVAALPQNTTNGNTTLGTLDASTLPFFLTDQLPPDGIPFDSNLTGVNTNPYEQAPVTNVTRYFDFTIARGFIAPDGVNKSCLLINNQFPGPNISANWGDTIEVTVHNRITGPEEGTSLHWHGLLQRETPWYDGVPSVGQCPIAPGKDFTYRFQAGLYGTSWYHSHYSAQYADGLFGPMVIYGPNLTTNPLEAAYDIDLGPVILTDWYHRGYFDIVKEQESNNPPPSGIPIPSNNLINGKMNFQCPQSWLGVNCTNNAGLSKFKFTSGKVHRIRLINAGAEALQRFTIDNHDLKVITNDFVPIKNYTTKMVTLGAGQRTDILVNATGKPTDSVFMRSDISETCTGGDQPYALAAIYYEEADPNATPKSQATSYDDSVCGNDPLNMTEPLYVYGPQGDPAVTQTIDLDFRLNASTNGSLQWFMNGSPFRANYNHPLLLLANQGNTSYPDDPQWNVYNFGNNNSVRIILRNHVNAPHAAHPMHLHGHNFFVLAEGYGDWDGTITTNITNPTRRDTHMMRQADPSLGPSYIVIQFDTDNPGVWPLHCHRAWHVSSGLYVNIMEHPDHITQQDIPQVMPQTCFDWEQYTSNNVVDQIDSGLRLRDFSA